MRNRIAFGLPINPFPCSLVVSSPSQCCRRCKRNRRCRGWAFTEGQDCRHVRKGPSERVCTLLSDVVGNYVSQQRGFDYFAGWNIR